MREVSLIPSVVINCSREISIFVTLRGFGNFSVFVSLIDPLLVFILQMNLCAKIFFACELGRLKTNDNEIPTGQCTTSCLNLVVTRDKVEPEFRNWFQFAE